MTTWHVFDRSWAGGGCERCGAKTGLVTVYYARPRDRWLRTVEADYVLVPRPTCLDRRACTTRKGKRQERARVRGSLIVLEEPKAPRAPRGTCRWCGESIELVDPDDYRRRQRTLHYGDRFEVGGHGCRAAYVASRVWSARDAVLWRGDSECVDCGDEGPDWEADHEVALEDGGTHELDNFRRRCGRCHRVKTAREARVRAGRRRAEAPGDPAQMTL